MGDLILIINTEGGLLNSSASGSVMNLCCVVFCPLQQKAVPSTAR